MEKKHLDNTKWSFKIREFTKEIRKTNKRTIKVLCLHYLSTFTRMIVIFIYFFTMPQLLFSLFQKLGGRLDIEAMARKQSMSFCSFLYVQQLDFLSSIDKSSLSLLETPTKQTEIVRWNYKEREKKSTTKTLSKFGKQIFFFFSLYCYEWTMKN